MEAFMALGMAVLTIVAVVLSRYFDAPNDWVLLLASYIGAFTTGLWTSSFTHRLSLERLKRESSK